MNLDIFATTQFGDAMGLKSFFLAHRYIHDATSAAITTKYGITLSTYGMDDERALEAWIKRMQEGKEGKTPDELHQWLTLHQQVHVNTYAALGQSDTEAPDLSEVDFGQKMQFDDWMLTHQSMHDFEQSQLGIT